jgi:uncharacterized protein (DUF1800 family)
MSTLARWRFLPLFMSAAILLGVSGRSLAQTPGDQDGDGLPDAWEDQYGLSHVPGAGATGDNGAAGDPDGDGVNNAAEYAAGSHPRGTFTRLFAEGATGWFDTRFALFNADLADTSKTLIRFLREDGTVISRYVALRPGERLTVNPKDIDGLQVANFSTIIESDTTVVADRTMMWDSRHYGSHAETGLPRASTTWYLAEGATTGDFSLFYLLQNPQPVPAAVTVTFLLPYGPPLVKKYTVAANSRMNITVDSEDPILGKADVSSVIQSSVPIVVERAMYTNPGGQAFGAGSASAGIYEPATQWFLAEGATGPYFDLFVLIANPNAETAELEVTFLRDSGKPVVKTYKLAPRTRFTIPVDGIKGLETAQVSTIVRSTNGVPVLVERTMYWPGPSYGKNYWTESHSASGVTSTATRWALADGEQGLADKSDTYVLIANTSAFAADAKITVYFEDGGAETKNVKIGANNRATFYMRELFPTSMNRRFATTVEGLGSPAPQLVVERSMYSDAEGKHWAAGTAALGTPLPDGALVTNPAAITVTAGALQVFEQGSQGTMLTFARGTATDDVTVYYTVGGTATPGSDYQTLTGRVALPAGTLTVKVPIVVYDDITAESPESITVTLLPDANYHIGVPSMATIQVEDNDTVVVPASDIDAARFLTQATFGPWPDDVAALKTIGYDAWIAQQMAYPASSFLGYLDSLGRAYTEEDLAEAWGKYAVLGVDQLRQRVSNALIEIMVLSNQNGLSGIPEAQAAYMDILQRNAFGNFRTLLEDVTRSPAMGQYLSHLKNDKPGTNHDPDENYAREVLQLFTIGLIKLNQDGTPMLNAGATIPTYDQSVIEGFANVFTGWTYYQASCTKFYDAPANWRMPMCGVEARHSKLQKPLLDNEMSPGGLIGPDLQFALDMIFNHPNVAPFFGRQLIQRLVTSNPSPAYIARVSAVFNNNGAGVRGDLAAVVRAILLDPEARNVSLADDAHYGKLREPMVRFAGVLRAFHGGAPNGRFNLSNLQNDIGQGPFKSPSVFNFFEPDFSQPGVVADIGLYSPEFQITTERWVAQGSNTLRNLVRSGYGSGDRKITLNLTTETALAGSNFLQLIDRLNLLLLNGQMSSELRNTLIEAIGLMPADKPANRAMVAVSLVVSSPEFAIQK